MARAIATFCKTADLDVATLSIDTLTNLAILPRVGVMIGGGSIVNHGVMRHVSSILKSVPVSMVGVEVFGPEPSSYDLPNLNFAAVRSPRSRDRLRAYGVKNIEVGPDVVWANIVGHKQATPEQGCRILGLNVTAWPKPYHWKCMQAGYALDNDSASQELLFRYCRFVSNFVNVYSNMGWAITFIPFEHGDDLFARCLFYDVSRRCRWAPYSPCVERVGRRMDECSTFVASRYHAHIFALQRRVPLISVGYSMQVEQLQRILAIPTDLRFPVAEPTLDANEGLGFVLGESTVSTMRVRANTLLRSAVVALGS